MKQKNDKIREQKFHEANKKILSKQRKEYRETHIVEANFIKKHTEKQTNIKQKNTTKNTDKQTKVKN